MYVCIFKCYVEEGYFLFWIFIVIKFNSINIIDFKCVGFIFLRLYFKFKVVLNINGNIGYNWMWFGFGYCVK